ncbi:MAG: OmpA/MotB domain protein [Mycobacterium sp.]|jgi:chemotaxis protein MotB|nr:OmpA/MotB domain protein [Mycobacterium sp.]
MPRKHRGGSHEEEHENSERWLLTYADMITLLMCLFIVLYSMSVLNKSKFEAFQSSLKQNKATGQPDIAKPAVNPTTNPQPVSESNTLTQQQLQQLAQKIQTALTSAGMQNDASVTVNSKGLTVDIVAGVLFDTGQAELRPDGLKVLAAVAPTLADVGNPISVEGHTDNQPITGVRYPSNWELSTDRAGTVVRWLLQNEHLDPTRMTAEGYADTRPLVPNDSPAHQGENRRVALVVKAAAASTPTAIEPTATASVTVAPTAASKHG